MQWILQTLILRYDPDDTSAGLFTPVRTEWMARCVPRVSEYSGEGPAHAEFNTGPTLHTE